MESVATSSGTTTPSAEIAEASQHASNPDECELYLDSSSDDDESDDNDDFLSVDEEPYGHDDKLVDPDALPFGDLDDANLNHTIYWELQEQPVYTLPYEGEWVIPAEKKEDKMCDQYYRSSHGYYVDLTSKSLLFVSTRF